MQRSKAGLTLRTAIMLGALAAMIGCSSSPNEEETKQLNDLKEEVASLQKDAAAREQDRATIEREVAEKNARLKKCGDDQQVVRQRLAK